MCILSALLPHKTSMPFLANTQVAPCLQLFRALALPRYASVRTLPDGRLTPSTRRFPQSNRFRPMDAPLSNRAYSVSLQLVGLDPSSPARLFIPLLPGAGISLSRQQTSLPPVRRIPAKNDAEVSSRTCRQIRLHTSPKMKMQAVSSTATEF